jgi:uncharacterized protein (TIGR03435 family)
VIVNRIALPILLLACTSAGAAQQPRPTFEVASVKPQAKPTTLEEFIAWPRPQPGGRLAGTHSTLEQLILFAYNVKSFQLAGGPEWIRTEYFDVDARAASPVPVNQLRLMAQSLLEERFTLVTHTEQRDMSYLALVLARADRQPGPNLHRIDEQACIGRTVREVHLEKFPAGSQRGGANPGGGTIGGACQDMRVTAELVTLLSGTLVIDKTGLSGLWVFDAPYSGGLPARAGSPRLGAPVPVEAVPGLPFGVALEEQLGLKLESARGPVDVLVIDSVRPLTEN